MPTDEEEFKKLNIDRGPLPDISLADGAELPETDLTLRRGPVSWEIPFRFGPGGNNLLKYMFGYRMPNNWLKMHGYPIKRRAWRNKQRKRMRKSRIFGIECRLVSHSDDWSTMEWEADDGLKFLIYPKEEEDV